jgi:hypothetical protein
MQKFVLSVLSFFLPKKPPAYTFPDGVQIPHEDAWVSRVAFREGYDAHAGSSENPYPAGTVNARSWQRGSRERDRDEMFVL